MQQQDPSTAPVWLITGCSTGFGRELARTVLDRGYRAVVTARNVDAVRDLAEGREGQALALALDVTDAEQAEHVVRAAEAEFGRIDVLVNNAGIGYFGAIEESDETEVRRMFEVNVFGLARMIHVVLPGMRARRSGHVVNIASIGGLRAFPAVGYYNATKFAVVGLSEALALEVEPLGIKVTIVEPSGFRTDWAGSSMSINEPGPDYEGTVGQMIRLNRDHTPVGDPAKAAAAILRIVDEPEPPLRLALGNDAVDMIRAADEAKLAEIDRWEELGRSADFEDAERHDLSILERS
jgi:NAD(P)-dependent dehydrogenase (short-subunit alcohol dehydrogenase family)